MLDGQNVGLKWPLFWVCGERQFWHNLRRTKGQSKALTSKDDIVIVGHAVHTGVPGATGGILVALLGDVGCTDGAHHCRTNDLLVEVWHHFSLQLFGESECMCVSKCICVRKKTRVYGNEEIEKESERKRKRKGKGG